jgi:hypothetical protein
VLRVCCVCVVRVLCVLCIACVLRVVCRECIRYCIRSSPVKDVREREVGQQAVGGGQLVIQLLGGGAFGWGVGWGRLEAASSMRKATTVLYMAAIGLGGPAGTTPKAAAPPNTLQ